MGNFYNIKMWLEDREVQVLQKYNFSEEVWSTEIDETEKYIMLDLELKGFIRSDIVNGKTYYQGVGGYKQLFNN